MSAIALYLAIATGLPASLDSKMFWVRSFQCVGSPHSRTQTGFRIKGQRGIVTALHGVVGCKRIMAEDEPGLLATPLTVSKVDVAADSALLLSEELAALPLDGYELSKTVVSARDPLTVVGHPLGIRNYRSAITAAEAPLVRLEDLLPAAIKTSLRNRNSPNPERTVLSIQHADIYPGHSGAPILDSDGHAIAMADGGIPGELVGLRGGIVGIAWAIPLHQIRWESAESNEGVLRHLARSDAASLFAFEEPAPKPIAPDARSIVEDLAEILLDTMPCSIMTIGAEIANSACPNKRSGFCDKKSVLTILQTKKIGDLSTRVLRKTCDSIETLVNRGSSSRIHLHCDTKGDWSTRHSGEFVGRAIFSNSSKYSLIRELLWVQNLSGERSALVDRVLHLSGRHRDIQRLEVAWRNASGASRLEVVREGIVGEKDDWSIFKTYVFDSLLLYYSDPAANNLPRTNNCADLCMCPNTRRTRWLLQSACTLDEIRGPCLTMNGFNSPGANRISAIKFTEFLLPNGPGSATQGDVNGSPPVVSAGPSTPGTDADRPKEIGRFTDQARLVPSFNNGNHNGWKLFAIKPGSTYSRLGIQNGDILFRLGHKSLVGLGLDDIGEAFASMPCEGTIEIEMMRRGRQTTLLAMTSTSTCMRKNLR